MNERQMKKGLRLLADDGWFGVKITDEYVDGFLGREWEPRSDELRESFVSRLRIRIQDAAIKNGVPGRGPQSCFFWAIHLGHSRYRKDHTSRNRRPLGKRERYYVEAVEEGGYKSWFENLRLILQI